ncbi:hypothetical protein CKA32_000077 [Geitlerinema sp. FC II]|nr:hypothetical protein CKA32_000077 [Geitlerinema sp. FC II]
MVNLASTGFKPSLTCDRLNYSVKLKYQYEFILYSLSKL